MSGFSREAPLKSLDQIFAEADRAERSNEDWSNEGYERLAAAVAAQPEERSTGFLVVFFSIVGFALGCLVTAAVLYSKAWGG